MAAVKPLSDPEAAQIRKVLPTLLKDRTTGGNIIWATDTYEQYGEEYRAKAPIQLHLITGRNAGIIQARITKARTEQADRTRKRAEVFTPVWICNLMLNHLDEEWFGCKAVFNHMDNKEWQPTEGAIVFPEKRSWKTYVDSRRLEITCGEAPFLVSRYDAVSGDSIPFFKRIGALDRKLRVVNEHACDWDEWWKFTLRAFESTYGYEYQGDNLFIARVNLMLTFLDALRERWQREATEQELKEIARTISWNLWQMDGLKGTVPFGSLREARRQLTIWELLEGDGYTEPKYQLCRIHDWRGQSSMTYIDRITRKGKEMKFDFVIGNPPYQDETVGEQKTFAPPVYHRFLDGAYQVGNIVEMIHPARFLFNAGATPKEWNQKMLNDKHLKVLFHEQCSDKIFSGTDIKGGVVITYRDVTQNFGAIGTYTAYPELNTIVQKIKKSNYTPISTIISNRGLYRFSKLAYSEEPQELAKITDSRIGASSFERMPSLFLVDKPTNQHDYIQMLGLYRGKRVYRWFRKDYFNMVKSFESYRVLLPAANGSGELGEVLSSPIIGQPYTGHTETFMTIGNFHTACDAEACLKYIKSKFCRVALGVLKITQHNSAEKWQFVPLQDFTPASDIDWSASIADIDRQLYRKYGLSEEEITFIETHVKEMA